MNLEDFTIWINIYGNLDFFIRPFKWRLWPKIDDRDKGHYNSIQIRWLCFDLDSIVYINKKGKENRELEEKNSNIRK